jgi:hypothetical protein
VKGQFTFSESTDIESPSVTASTRLLVQNAFMFPTSCLLIIMRSDLSPSGEWHQSSWRRWSHQIYNSSMRNDGGFLSFPTWHHAEKLPVHNSRKLHHKRYPDSENYNRCFDISPFRDQPHRSTVKQAVLLQMNLQMHGLSAAIAETRIPDLV